MVLFVLSFIFPRGFAIVKLLLLLLVSFLIISCDEDSPTVPEQTIFEIQGENGFVVEEFDRTIIPLSDANSIINELSDNSFNFKIKTTIWRYFAIVL